MRQDFSLLTRRTGCNHCREVGHVSWSGPKKRTPALTFQSNRRASVRAVTCSDDFPCSSTKTVHGPSVDVTVNDILSAPEETHLEKLVWKERSPRLSRDCPDSEEEEDPRCRGARCVCHRPGCAVSDAGCAKTLTGRPALDRHAAVTGVRPPLVARRLTRQVQRVRRRHSAVGRRCGSRVARWRPDDPFGLMWFPERLVLSRRLVVKAFWRPN